MSEEEMKLEARLLALEHVLHNLLANFYLIGNFSRAQIEAGHSASAASLSRETLPGADPVQADMWLAEIRDAVTELQSSALQNWAEKRRKAGLPD